MPTQRDTTELGSSPGRRPQVSVNRLATSTGSARSGRGPPPRGGRWRAPLVLTIFVAFHTIVDAKSSTSLHFASTAAGAPINLHAGRDVVERIDGDVSFEVGRGGDADLCRARRSPRSLQALHAPTARPGGTTGNFLATTGRDGPARRAGRGLSDVSARGPRSVDLLARRLPLPTACAPGLASFRAFSPE